jgi:hypothetical protein
MCRDIGEMIVCETCHKPVCTYQGATGCIQLTAESGRDNFKCPSCYRKAREAVPVSVAAIPYLVELKQLRNAVSCLRLQLPDLHKKFNSFVGYLPHLRTFRRGGGASPHEDNAFGGVQR